MKKLFSHLRSTHAKNRSRAAWQECGLAAGYILGRHFLNLDDLHYGYWPRDLEVNVANLKSAQANYSRWLLSHIPQEATRVLDVGAGTGSVAARLVERGHRVDCVSPSNFLTQRIRDRLGDKVHVFKCQFEKMKPLRTYDAVLFAESFQYVPFHLGLKQAIANLNPGGRIVICDFFAKDDVMNAPIRGGHPLRKFHESLSTYPLQIIEDIDITAETAPTISVANDAFANAIQPIWMEFWRTLNVAHPLWAKATRRLFQKRIDKFERKYFSGARTLEAFQNFKEYRLIHLRLTPNK